MRRIGIVVLLVLAHLAVTLVVPAARAAKAFVPPASGSELAAAGAAAHRGAGPTNVCRLGAGVLACPYYLPAQPAAALPTTVGTTAHPPRIEPLPSGRSVPTPLRPPRLSA